MPDFRIGDRVTYHRKIQGDYPLPLQLGDLGTVIETEQNYEQAVATLMSVKFDRDNEIYFVYDWEVEHA